VNNNPLKRELFEGGECHVKELGKALWGGKNATVQLQMHHGTERRLALKGYMLYSSIDDKTGAPPIKISFGLAILETCKPPIVNHMLILNDSR